MRPRVEGHGTYVKARVRKAADQARPAARCAAAFALLLGLPACGGLPRDADPRIMIGNLFGAHLEGREPPPGLDQPWPNLASVPPRPVPPDPATRAAISTGLTQDRESSREPAAPGATVPGLPAAPQGGPPPPPRLAAVPPVRLDPQAPPAPRAVPPSQGQQAAPASRAEPAPQATPAPAPLGPPPAPAPELLAPPPPPSSDLLAPRRE